MDDAKTFIIEDAQLIFRNFTGTAGPYNKEGEKSFAVILDEKTAKAMAADGWNVKVLKSREEDEVGDPYIQVKVNFAFRPPRVTLITSTARTTLNDESIGVLDWADIQTCDLIARAFDWEVNGKTGIAAYLQTMFVTIEEDALERKYALQEIANNE